MNKKEAADYLGISTRALERYTSLQRIGVRYEKGKTGDQATFDEDELRRFKDQLSNHRRVLPAIDSEASPSPDTQPRQLARLSDVAPLAIFERMTAALEGFQRQSDPSQLSIVDLAAKLTLSLTEASQLSGLSRAYLRQAIEEKKLKARIIGKGWRVKRADLDSYVKKL